ncbi:tautomerase family protein [Streptomyces canus]|uniref:tautomerase family protein n=1 Tax=Streptomyces canus TaxID=58343 RepID=UPI0036C4A041
MPYWEIHTPENAYTEEDKEQFATAITKACVDFVGIPAFYIVVRFHEYPADTMYVGGKAQDNFVHAAGPGTEPDLASIAG